MAYSMSSCNCVNKPKHPNCDEIKSLRRDIDKIDESIMIVLVQRHFLSKKVQALKVNQGQESLSVERELEIRDRLKFEFPSIPAEVIDGIYDQILPWMKN